MPTLASSRAASATRDRGSRARSRRAAKTWRRAARRAGSIVGPTRTIGPTCSGRAAASSVTTWHPIELATTAGRERPFASSQLPSAAASDPRVVCPGSGLLSPVPADRVQTPRTTTRGRGRGAACTSPRRRSREAARRAGRRRSQPRACAIRRRRSTASAARARAGHSQACASMIAERRRPASPDPDEAEEDTRSATLPRWLARASARVVGCTRLVGRQERGR